MTFQTFITSSAAWPFWAIMGGLLVAAVVERVHK